MPETSTQDWPCGFCGRTRGEYSYVARGPVAPICNHCVQLIMQQMVAQGARFPGLAQAPTQTSSSTSSGATAGSVTPRWLYEQLGDYVVGQHQARETIAIAAYQHFKRINEAVNYPEVELDKSNILLLGPTGSGKTLIAETLSKLLNVPFSSDDANSLTQMGYVGRDVDSILGKLLENAGQDPAQAERGIVYIDEIDKLCSTGNQGAAIDIGQSGVQNDLLKMIEGDQVEVTLGDKRFGGEKVTLNTKNILFICGGAFSGIEEVIKKRAGRQGGIGFQAPVTEATERTDTSWYDQIQPRDLVEFGLMPEFVGRLPVITPLKPLDKKAMVDILTQPKNALVRQYKTLFDMDNIQLEFNEDALDAIAEQALARDTGARGLRSIVEATLRPLMFDAPSQDLDTLVVDRSMVEQCKASS